MRPDRAAAASLPELPHADALERPAGTLLPESLSPEDSASFGAILMRQERWADATLFFSRAIRERPSSFSWAQLGKALMKLGELDGALEAYGRSLELAPTNRYAIVGHAAVVAQHPRSDLSALAAAFHRLLTVQNWHEQAIVASTAASVLRAICASYPNEVLSARAARIEELVAELRRTPDGRASNLERRLREAMLVQDLFGPPSLESAIVARRIDRGPTQRALLAGSGEPAEVSPL